MKKIKVGIVNYLNTAPLIYGIEHTGVMKEIELIPDYPANLAKDLIDGNIDIGLVPVAVIPQLEDWWLIGDYCIGADGAVASVCLFSEVPVEEITTVMLDYQSRTSLELAKILLTHHWKKRDIKFVPAAPGFENKIEGTTAAVVIGDRALALRKTSPYVYDLAEVWKNFTGLPFVFAAWVSNKPLNESFIQLFNEANKYGVQNIPAVISGMTSELIDLDQYYRTYISYSLDQRKREGLQKFLDFLHPGIIVPV